MKNEIVKRGALVDQLATLTPAEATKAREFLEGAWAPETRRAYGWGWRVFTEWCEAAEKTALPAAPAVVVLFVQAQTEAGTTASSLRTQLAAVKWAHEMKGFASPTYAPEVKLAWKAAAARLGVAAAQPKAPLTLDLMAKVLAQVDRTTLTGKRNAAVLLLGFHAALRRSELAGLLVEDVRPAPGGVAVRIRRSKTDQQGEGQVVGVAARGDELCAVRALNEWKTAAGIKAGRLFRAFQLDGTLRETFGAKAVATIVKRYGAPAGLLPETLGGHSLRAGFVTEAYRRGASEAEIIGSTRHRTTATLTRYRREADPVARGASNRMRK